MPKVLILAYHFPPSGTGGVGRALGWARHLPALGWEVSVLAATPAPNWPLDASLVEQIPPAVTVHRTATADPRPEGQRGLGRRELSFFWYRPALALARSLLKRQRFDVMLATVPPPVAHRLAHRLGREFNIPWVADFRDPWTVRAPALWRRWRRRVYAREAADCVAVNRTLALHLQEDLKRPVATIFNGFEPDEMPGDVGRAPRRAVYLGTLPELSVLDGLFASLARVDGEFLHIGWRGGDELAARARDIGLKRVQQTGYLPRAEALRMAATGSVFITALEGGLTLTLPTKVFDYLGLGGPILHVGKRGATAEFIALHGLGESIGPHDVAEMSRALARLWNGPLLASEDVKSRFTRRRQAEATSKVLSEVIQSRRP